MVRASARSQVIRRQATDGTQAPGAVLPQQEDLTLARG